MARIITKTETEAWDIARMIFPTSYELDTKSSERAGYSIYRSTEEGHYYDYICNLGDRLELNLSNGKTVNVWIEHKEEQTEEEQTEEETVPVENESFIIHVEVTTGKTKATKKYDSYSDFIEDFRFFLAGGKWYDYMEKRFESAIRFLHEETCCGDSVTISACGMDIKLKYIVL